MCDYYLIISNQIVKGDREETPVVSIHTCSIDPVPVQVYKNENCHIYHQIVFYCFLSFSPFILQWEFPEKLAEADSLSMPELKIILCWKLLDFHWLIYKTGWMITLRFLMRSITIKLFLWSNGFLEFVCWALDPNILVCLYICWPKYLIYNGWNKTIFHEWAGPLTTPFIYMCVSLRLDTFETLLV